MDSAIAGRDAVLDRAWQALGARGAVVVEGPPGIGKTAVWRTLVAEAHRSGWLVLQCAPAETEAALAFAALADVLRPLAGAVPDLPGPQRLAASAALLSTESEYVVDERSVGAATRSLLDTAVAGSAAPVLVAVDDAQWLDRPSERALRFALRRTAPIATLVTCRSAETGQQEAPLGLDHLQVDDRLVRIGLEPLGVGALHHVLRARLGATLSRPLLARIAHDAGGNPLLAMELARAVLRLPRLPLPGEDLPVASSLQQLTRDALTGLPPASREAVRLAALLAVPNLRDLAAAGVAQASFDAAEEAGLLVVRPASVEFTHPVYAAAVRSGIPSGVRRRLHRTLAAVVADRDERVRQLAHCTVEPDAAIARELADAAHRQRARGAPSLAAELHERSAELTPHTAAADRGSRRLAAVRCLIDCGDYAAAAVAAEAAAVELTGDLRAEALLLRAMVAWCADDPGDIAIAAAKEALAAVTAGTPEAGRIHAHLGVFYDAPEPARHHAEAAAALLAGSDGDHALRAAAMFLQLFSEVRVGLPARTELIDHGLELERGEPSWLAGTIPAIWWKSIDEHDRARERLQLMLRRAVEHGDEPSQHELLTHLGEAEILAGCWSAAEEHIAAAQALGEQLGTRLVTEVWLAGMLAAHRGRLAEARQIAEAGLHRAIELGDAWARRIHLHLTGFVAVSAGQMGEAVTAYRGLVATIDETGLVEPLSQRFEPDWIEACVGAGDLTTAAEVMDRLAQRHARLPRPWTTLGLARSRVLLDSARGGDPTAALDELVAARASVPADVVPLDRARCLLAAGMAHRRARRKREARSALSTAADEFAALGAQAFADRAAAELSRVAGRRPAPLDLTATEDRVARLAAMGRTNRVIADELFLSPKTVEANLARVYRKLGISSRAELGAAMVNRPLAQ